MRFGEAITLDGLDKKDKEACQDAYERVKVCAPVTTFLCLAPCPAPPFPRVITSANSLYKVAARLVAHHVHMTHTRNRPSSTCPSSSPHPHAPRTLHCIALHSNQDEVEVGIDSLLRAREQDPYLDPATRLLYERVKGEAAPTFPSAVLDAAVARTRLAREGKRRRQRRRETGSERVEAAGAADDGAAPKVVEVADTLADKVVGGAAVEE